MRPLLVALLIWPALAWAADGGAVDAGAPDAAPDAAPAAPPAKGPPPEITYDCAPDPVRIGEAVVCTLTAVHPADVSVTVTAPPAFEMAPPAPASTREDGKLETIRTFTTRPTSMRKVRVGGVAVIWQESTGGEGRVQLDRKVIATRSVLGGEGDPAFRDYDDVAEATHGAVPYRVFNWPLFIALCVLGGGAVGLGIGVAIKRWLDGRHVDEGPPVDPRPAHVIAYEALDRLAAEDLPGQGRVGEYYVRLSEIIRAYLDRRYGVDAPEMTSDQIRAWAVGAELTSEARLGLDDFLAETDLVKFADFSPTESELDTVTRLARGLIALTRRPDRELEATAAAETPEATA